MPEELDGVPGCLGRWVSSELESNHELVVDGNAFHDEFVGGEVNLGEQGNHCGSDAVQGNVVALLSVDVQEGEVGRVLVKIKVTSSKRKRRLVDTPHVLVHHREAVGEQLDGFSLFFLDAFKVSGLGEDGVELRLDDGLMMMLQKILGARQDRGAVGLQFLVHV